MYVCMSVCVYVCALGFTLPSLMCLKFLGLWHCWLPVNYELYEAQEVWNWSARTQTTCQRTYMLHVPGPPHGMLHSGTKLAYTCLVLIISVFLSPIFRSGPRTFVWPRLHVLRKNGSGTSPEEHLPSLAKPKKKDSWFKQTPVMLKQARSRLKSYVSNSLEVTQTTSRISKWRPFGSEELLSTEQFSSEGVRLFGSLKVPLVIGIMKKMDIQIHSKYIILWSHCHGMVSFPAQLASQILSNNRATKYDLYICWFPFQFGLIWFNVFQVFRVSRQDLWYNWRSNATCSVVFFSRWLRWHDLRTGRSWPCRWRIVGEKLTTSHGYSAFFYRSVVMYVCRCNIQLLNWLDQICLIKSRFVWCCVFLSFRTSWIFLNWH